MKRFWQHLSQISKGQLFSGGYLSKEVAVRLNEECRTANAKRVGENQRCHHAPPRLAIPH